jgi:uncharacterized protein YcbX
MEVRVWSDVCQATEIIESNAGCWFSTFLGIEGIKLVRMHDRCVRKTDPKYAPNGQTSFSDGYPFLLVSEASLACLNNKSTTYITMERFRPNIVVTNCRAFAEDSWKHISIHCQDDDMALSMHIVKPCSRCSITNIDPATAIPSPDTTLAMKRFRTGEQLSLPESEWRKEVSPVFIKSVWVVLLTLVVCIGVLWTECGSCGTSWAYSQGRCRYHYTRVMRGVRYA